MPQEIPLAPGFPVVGNAPGLLKDPLALFFRMYQELGPVFRVNAPGRSYVVLAGPDANRGLHDWEEAHMISGPVYHPYVQDIHTDKVLVGMDGDPHRRFRKWLHPGFSREAIKPHLPAMVAAAGDLFPKFQAGDTMNVTDVLQFLIAQMTGIAMAGCPVEGHFQDAKKFAHIFLGAGVGGFPGVMRWFPDYRLARARFKAFLSRNIQVHRENPAGERFPDFIDLLLREQGPDGPPLTETEILASAHMPYTNSLVYVAATCGFMLYELLKHPEILEKVQQEAGFLFADGPPDMSQLMRAKWLKASLMETQRIHPISLSIPRYVHKSFEFKGYVIQAGEQTLTATAVTHFLPEFFPEPEKFDVERYWPPRLEHRHPNVFVPFGLGPHVCLSAGMVNMITMLAVGKLVHHFDLALEPGDYQLGLRVAPFPAPEPGFEVRVDRVRSEHSAARGAHSDAGPEEILHEFNLAQFGAVASRARKQHFNPGAWIIAEGAPADAMYILSAGTVSVIKTGVDQKSRVVATLKSGDYFGEIGLLQDVPRTASVKAETPVEAIVLDKETFIELVTATDMTSEEIAGVMRQRIVSTALAASLPKLSLAHVSEISPKSEILMFAAGEKIIQQGDAADKFYILVRGEVEVINEHPDGREIYLNTLHQGDYFGEIGLIQNRPRNATIRVSGEGEVEVIALDRKVFLDALEDSDATNAQVALEMAERLSQLIESRGSS
jgi:cytochrome P450/CRP-like cAMP-binding protein